MIIYGNISTTGPNSKSNTKEKEQSGDIAL